MIHFLFYEILFLELSTLLGVVNKLKFKVNLKNIFVFILTVLFYCEVGVSDVDTWARNGPIPS